MLNNKNHHSKQQAFTIVELLIVIVVIAILAAITIVAFNGIRDRAENTKLKSELAGHSKVLKADQALADGKFPATLATANQGKGLTGSGGAALEYSVDNSTGSPKFCLSAVKGKYTASISQSGSASEAVCPGHAGPGGVVAFNGITKGSQVWALANENVGIMLTGDNAQTNNSIVEKYCYNDIESNCATHGALYAWDEAMQYSAAEGAQGICPAGSHVPTENDWRILEMSLGMSQPQAHTSGKRGTDQGAQLKQGGSSGLNIPLAGVRANGTGGWSFGMDQSTALWTSTVAYGDMIAKRSLTTWDATVEASAAGRVDSHMSVRCVGN